MHGIKYIKFKSNFELNLILFDKFQDAKPQELAQTNLTANVYFHSHLKEKHLHNVQHLTTTQRAGVLRRLMEVETMFAVNGDNVPPAVPVTIVGSIYQNV